MNITRSRNCRKLLDSWTVETHSGELFCRNCYNRLFTPTSVRPSLPIPTSPFLPSVDKKNSSVSPSKSLSDSRCCCCDEKCLTPDTSNESPELIVGISSCPLEKNRLRGGGGYKEVFDPRCSDLEADNDTHSCGKDIEQLDLRTCPITICDQPFGPPAVTAWYNRHQSASQSTFSRPSSANQNLLRSSSTPVSGEVADICDTCNLNCSGSRRPGSPCRPSHKHCEHSRQCHRNRCHDSRRSDRLAIGFQGRRDSIEDCCGRNFAQNYRDHLRSQLRYLQRFGPRVLLAESSIGEKVQNFVVFGKNSIIIDSGGKKFVQATLSSPSRKRVSFLFPKNIPPRSAATRYCAMQKLSLDKIHNDLVSSGGSVEVPNHPIQQSNTQVEIHEDSDKPDGFNGEIRMRGGCGGGGGSSGGRGCGCGSGGGRTNYDESSHSPLRHQAAQEGGCGCGSGRNSEFEARGSSRGLGSDDCSSHFPRFEGYTNNDSEERIPGSCAAKFPAGSHLTRYETCPPRSPDRCSPDPASLSPCNAVACSPPCSGRKNCCPSAGQRSEPRKKSARCRPPCSGASQSCGGGGCCGSGCRGNCGKPGQTCLPLRPCTIPPCMPRPQSGRSPCLPPRASPPQPSCCRMPVLLGTPNTVSGGGCGGGGLTSCRTKSPGARTGGGGGCSPLKDRQQQDVAVFDLYGQQKVPPGCECLGGGQDCQRCRRKVYQAEMMIASGVPYHNICFSCFCCRKPLETLTYHENCGEIYCKQCYVRNFGPQGYGYSGVLQTPM